jgi:dolichyl-phosphate beta-glucosyltransferase
MGIKYSVILPAYNEAETVSRAIRETAGVFGVIGDPYEILLVDDGSTDATRSVAESLKAEIPQLGVIVHEVNRGKGAAVRTGVMAARGEALLFLDCDLAVHPLESRAFIGALGDNDIAIGSRRHPDAVIAKPQPWYRIAYGRLINFFIRKTLRLPHHDTQCGFKMFSATAAKDVFAEAGESRWLFDAEILLRAHERGYRIAELPVTWTDGGSSRVRAGHVLSDLRLLLVRKKHQD